MILLTRIYRVSLPSAGAERRDAHWDRDIGGGNGEGDPRYCYAGRERVGGGHEGELGNNVMILLERIVARGQF